MSPIVDPKNLKKITYFIGTRDGKEKVIGYLIPGQFYGDRFAVRLTDAPTYQKWKTDELSMGLSVGYAETRAGAIDKLYYTLQGHDRIYKEIMLSNRKKFPVINPAYAKTVSKPAKVGKKTALNSSHLGDKRTRLSILQASLQKKEVLFNKKLSEHIDDVKSANGQPLNNKRNGAATVNRWDRQNDSLKSLKQEIEKTKIAVEKEEIKQAGVGRANKTLPQFILQLIKEKKLTQWQKHPNVFFVPGVEKARIKWDPNTQIIYHHYTNAIPNAEQYKKFVQIFNDLNREVKNLHGL